MKKLVYSVAILTGLVAPLLSAGGSSFNPARTPAALPGPASAMDYGHTIWFSGEHVVTRFLNVPTWNRLARRLPWRDLPRIFRDVTLLSAISVP